MLDLWRNEQTLSNPTGFPTPHGANTSGTLGHSERSYDEAASLGVRVDIRFSARHPCRATCRSVAPLRSPAASMASHQCAKGSNFLFSVWRRFARVNR